MDPITDLQLPNWPGPEVNLPPPALDEDIGIFVDAREPARAWLTCTEPGEAGVIDNPKVRPLSPISAWVRSVTTSPPNSAAAITKPRQPREYDRARQELPELPVTEDDGENRSEPSRTVTYSLSTTGSGMTGRWIRKGKRVALN
jgi:hypothetical protein